MTYTLTLSQAEIQVIANALGELPLKSTLGLFVNIQEQVKMQDDAQALSAEELVQMTDVGAAVNGGVPGGSAL